MSDRLEFSDEQSASDALVFAARAASLTEDAVRLQAQGGVLVMTAAALAPRGLGDPTPTILGMRMLAVDPELRCDLVVEAAALRADPDGARRVVLPEVAVSAAWAGIAPPRGGWERVAVVDAASLAESGRAGIAEVADALPSDPGEDVVRSIRAAVWGRPASALDGLPSGAAFAAVALGFIGGSESVPVLRSGAWTRLSLARGHVLIRGPQVSGLTPVRATRRTE